MSFDRRIVSGGETSTGAENVSDVLRQALEVERRLRQDRVDALARRNLEHRAGERRVGAAGHEVKRVAQVPSDRALAHVRADEPDLPLAVRPQCVEERSGSGRAGCRHEDGERSHARNVASSP